MSRRGRRADGGAPSTAGGTGAGAAGGQAAPAGEVRVLGGIRLNALLKLLGVAPTGGAGKRLIQDGRVAVDGMPETRRHRWLAGGEVVSVDGREWQVVADGPRNAGPLAPTGERPTIGPAARSRSAGSAGGAPKGEDEWR
jgi:ribosome-associated protein